MRASALRTVKRKEITADEARRKRFYWLKGKEGEVMRKPRTLKQQIEWSESRYSRSVLNVVPDTPEPEEVAKRSAVALTFTFAFVTLLYMAHSWKGQDQVWRSREDRPMALYVYTKEPSPEKEVFEPGKVLTRSPWPSQRPEREQKISLSKIFFSGRM